MRCLGLIFQVWIADRIGSVGVGLFQLVMSVDILASTVAISGIRFTTTRLVAEEIGLDRSGGVGRIMWRCTGYGMLFGTAAMLILSWKTDKNESPSKSMMTPPITATSSLSKNTGMTC